MHNQSRIIWIGSIIAIAFGLSIEALKSTRAASDSTWRPRLFGMNDLEDGDTTVAAGRRSSKSDTSSDRTREQADRARTRLLRGRLAGLETNAALTVTPAVVVAANPGVPNLAAPVAINADDLKKKAAEDAKKKKKKKKKKPTAEDTSAGQQPMPSPESDSSAKDKSSEVSGGSVRNHGGGVSHTQTVIGNNAQLNENPETLDQWLSYILREPNYDRTMKLIEAQQNHSLDSDIFHEVVTQMLSDAREKMHELAILALGSTPSLRSFLLLETANAMEANASPLKIQSRTYIKAYSRIENLRYLASAIAGALDTSTMYEALRLIQLAASTYKPKATPPSSGTTVVASATVSRQFTALVPALTRLQTTAADATVRQEASRALRDVNTLIGTSGTTTAPVVASGN